MILARFQINRTVLEFSKTYGDLRRSVVADVDNGITERVSTVIHIAAIVANQ